MVKRIVLDALHHRRDCNCLQRGAIQFYSHRVKRNIVLAGDPCSWRICSQPSLELVPSSSQLSAIRSHSVALEIEFPSRRRFSSGISSDRVTFELDDRARIVDVLTGVKGVSACVRSRRTAYAKCNNTQANRRE